MAHCTVIGSGPSGVHFALSALARGHSVEMIDVGHTAPDPVNPQDSFTDLKASLADPTAYFLGDGFEGVLLPGQQDAFYEMPPSKNYALRSVPGLALRPWFVSGTRMTEKSLSRTKSAGPYDSRMPNSMT